MCGRRCNGNSMGVQNVQIDPTEVGVMRTVMRIAAAVAIAAAVPVAGVSSAAAVLTADSVQRSYTAVERVEATGTVKWFNAEKGYGIIEMDGGGAEVFVHYSAIQSNGYRMLEAGQRVEFEVSQGQKGLQADRVRVIG